MHEKTINLLFFFFTVVSLTYVTIYWLHILIEIHDLQGAVSPYFSPLPSKYPAITLLINYFASGSTSIMYILGTFVGWYLSKILLGKFGITSVVLFFAALLALCVVFFPQSEHLWTIYFNYRGFPSHAIKSIAITADIYSAVFTQALILLIGVVLEMLGFSIMAIKKHFKIVEKRGS